MVIQALLFAGVGSMATLVHLSISGVLLHIGTNPFAANTAGFCAAFMLSFLGHRGLTFRSPAPRSHRTFPRYLAVAVTGLGTNQLILYALLAGTSLSAQTSIVLSTFAVAVLTFMLARLWAFRAPQMQQPLRASCTPETGRLRPLRASGSRQSASRCRCHPGSGA